MTIRKIEAKRHCGNDYVFRCPTCQRGWLAPAGKDVECTCGVTAKICEAYAQITNAPDDSDVDR